MDENRKINKCVVHKLFRDVYYLVQVTNNKTSSNIDNLLPFRKTLNVTLIYFQLGCVACVVTKALTDLESGRVFLRNQKLSR